MDFSALDRFIDSLPAYGISSSDCMVYYKHRPVYRHSAGCMDIEKGTPICPDALYYMYSCSKVVTCTAALQLFEQGKFLMTDPVGEYLPEFNHMTVQRRSADGKTELAPASRKMEIRHLFNMTAGLTYDTNTEYIRRLMAEKPDCSTREFVSAIAESPLVFEPGTHWNYSLCHDVLGALIEVISGKRFSAYVKENIFDPLGMQDSMFKLDPAKADRLAVQYVYDDQLGKPVLSGPLSLILISPNIESGGASVISTTEDYMRFAEAMCSGGTGLNGERILSPGTINLMRSNCLDETALADFNWIQMRGYGYGYGVRTMINPALGGSLSSMGEFGWGGAAGSYVMIDPDAEVSIIYTQHMLNNKEHYVHPRLRNIAYSCIF